MNSTSRQHLRLIFGLQVHAHPQTYTPQKRKRNPPQPRDFTNRCHKGKLETPGTHGIPAPLEMAVPTCAPVTYLPLAWGRFIQQEWVGISLKAMIGLGRPKGVTQVLGAGLRVGRRGGGDATAPAPVSAGRAAAAV